MGYGNMWHSVRVGVAGVAGVALAFLVAHLLSTPACADTLGADTLRIDTREGLRRAILLPSGHGPAPTVIVLHGAVNSAAWAVRRFGFVEAAAARGFTAVFPQGIGLQWNDGRIGLASGADDVSFLRRLVRELVAREIAEPHRVYIAGVSNGGMMALRMVCEAAELLAGAGTVIASMPASTGAECRPARPVPIVMFNGTADRLIPYDGGGVGPLNLGGLVWAAEETAAFLAHANGCDPRPMSGDASMELISATRITWSGCRREADVTLYRVNGGRHSVPGRRRILTALFGKRRDELSAAETIMAAFAHE
jgi:polyhydroxybutyrate depolymerase